MIPQNLSEKPIIFYVLAWPIPQAAAGERAATKQEVEQIVANSLDLLAPWLHCDMATPPFIKVSCI